MEGIPEIRHLLPDNICEDRAVLVSGYLYVSHMCIFYRTSVGALDDTDTFAYFSNYCEYVEIQAPVSDMCHTIIL